MHLGALGMALHIVWADLYDWKLTFLETRLVSTFIEVKD